MGGDSAGVMTAQTLMVCLLFNCTGPHLHSGPLRNIVSAAALWHGAKVRINDTSPACINDHVSCCAILLTVILLCSFRSVDITMYLINNATAQRSIPPCAPQTRDAQHSLPLN